MTIGIFTDATCDLTLSTIQSNNIHIIPMKAINEENNDFILDNKTPENTSAIQDLIIKKIKLKTEPAHSEEIKSFVLKTLNQFDYDEIIFITPLQSRSNSYENIMFTVPKIIQAIRETRNGTDLRKTVKIEVFDSQQISVGLGLMVSHACYYRNKNLTTAEILQKLKKLATISQSFLIPFSLTQLYSQATTKGESSVGLGSYLIGSALDIKPIILVHNQTTEVIAKIRGFDNSLSKILQMAKTHIEKNTLSKNNINITYSGSLKTLSENKDFVKFHKFAKEKNIKLDVSQMSPTMTINVGVGAFALSFSSNIINKEL